MTVFRHVRTKPGRAPLERHLPRQAGFDQGVQAIIDGGHRDLRHVALGPDKDFFRRRVIPFPQQESIDVLALRRKTKTAGSQLPTQLLIQFFAFEQVHNPG